MRKFNKIKYLLFSVLVTIGSCSQGTVSLESRSDKLTINYVAGTWRGQSEKDGIVLSETIKINKDGSFEEKGSSGISINGPANLQEFSSLKGSISFEIEEVKKEDGSNQTYFIHGITFNCSTNFGTRSCRYVFVNNNKINPITTFFSSDVSLEKIN
jgi:hypothetical protein